LEERYQKSEMRAPPEEKPKLKKFKLDFTTTFLTEAKKEF
jgi:hypothetical protein